MSIIEMMEALESELTGKQGLFSKKIDIDHCLDLIEQLKEEIAHSLKEADYVIERKREILQNADTVAKNTIREAEERADHAMGSHELLRRAESEGDKILETAYAQSESIVKKTKDHLDAMFKDIEEFLLSNLTMIRRNRDELRNATFINAK